MKDIMTKEITMKAKQTITTFTSITTTLPFLLLLILLPSASPDKFCGTSQSDAESTCWQPCGSSSDCCSFSQNCYETSSSCGSSIYSGSNHNYCGVSWCDAAYNCGTPCGEDEACPDGLYCFANVPCDRDGRTDPPPLPSNDPVANYNYCATTLEEAKSTCWQACPRGDDDCCLGLKCFATSTSSSGSSSSCGVSDYTGTNHFYCGASWCDAAYTCGQSCPGGSDEECPNGTYCYADVPCSSSTSPPDFDTPSSPGGSSSTTMYKYCGVDAGDANDRCWQDCNEDTDCCFSQRCYDTGSNCGAPFYDGTNHNYCGLSWCDAISKCSVPCPNGNECPADELCYSNTPCDSAISTNQPYYCGHSQAEASAKCWQPCPSGQDSECCFGQSCFDTGGTCMTYNDPNANRKFCGVDKCDANHKCATPCVNGDSDCPSGETCFEDTPCSSSASPPVYEFSYCGTSADDSMDTCWLPCRDDSDCCYGQLCYGSNTECDVPNYSGSNHFFCGVDYCDASFRCSKPCPSGYNAECDAGQSCFASTPCDSNAIAADSTVRYGLPVSAMNLAMQYVPSSGSGYFTLQGTKNILLLTSLWFWR